MMKMNPRAPCPLSHFCAWKLHSHPYSHVILRFVKCHRYLLEIPSRYNPSNYAANAVNCLFPNNGMLLIVHCSYNFPFSVTEVFFSVVKNEEVWTAARFSNPLVLLC